jgi:hypothetical protein
MLQLGLEASGRKIERNAPLNDLGGRFLSLRDGGCETIEEFINPPIYEFVQRPALVILVASSDPELAEGPEDAEARAARDRALDQEIEAVTGAFEAMANWPGYVTAWRMLPADFDTHEILGAARMKGCEIPFEIEFWSNRPNG